MGKQTLLSKLFSLQLACDTLCQIKTVYYGAVRALFRIFSVAIIPATPIFLQGICNVLEQFPRLIFNKCFTSI